jgi:hypothetical protein
MTTRLKLWDGRKVTVEQTMTGIMAHYDGEPEPKAISSTEYMRLVMAGTPCSE